MLIEYRCPIHGVVQPDTDDDQFPTCPLSLRRVVDGRPVIERCSEPLTAYTG
jgi:hypothetical protein